MKAVVVREPMVFDVEDVDVPDVPERGMLIKVRACGLCGSDLRTLRSGHRNVKFPWTIGHEICGEVVETGRNYSGKWKIGELLSIGPLSYCGTCEFCLSGRFDLCENQTEIGQAVPGGLAEYLAIPEKYIKLGNIQAVPDGMDPTHAAIVEPVSSCVNAQEKAGVTLGDSVVIIGSGPIGCIHISLARSRGAIKIFIIDISAERLKMAEAFNPDSYINASESDPVKRVLELTDGKGADVVITATPAPVAAVQAVQMAKRGGRIIQFGGMPKGNSTPGIDMNLVHYRGLHIIGTTTFSPVHNHSALKLIQSGQVPAEKLISHVFPLNDFKKGAALALEGKVLKGVFVP